MTLRSLLPLVLAAALPLATARAQEPSGIATAHITVVGNAVVEKQPDHAAVSIGVSARGVTASAVIDETSAAAGKIVETARAFGIEPRDIQTSYVALAPAFRNVRGSSGAFQAQPDGFQATNSVVIRVRDLSRLGEFMRRGVQEGAGRLGDLSFGLLDRSAAEREANTAAMAHAREQAETLAKAAGVKLGAIQEIKPVSRQNTPVRGRRIAAARAAASSEVPIEPGLLEIVAEIEVTWAIE